MHTDNPYGSERVQQKSKRNVTPCSSTRNFNSNARHAITMPVKLKVRKPTRKEKGYAKFLSTLAEYGWTTNITFDMYTGSNVYLPVFCPKGHPRSKSLDALGKQKKKGGENMDCLDCGGRDKSGPVQIRRRKDKFEEFRKIAEERGFTMLSTWEDYETNQTKLKLICHRDHRLENSWDSFQKDKNGCVLCTYDDKLTLTYEQVKDFIESRGCKLLSTEFRRVDEDLTIECACGTVKEQTFHTYRQASTGKCIVCYGSVLFEFSSGRQEFIQGYEKWLIEELLAGPHEIYGEINEEDMVIGEQKVPPVKYFFEGQERLYYPDIWVPSKNLYIEAKSERVQGYYPEKHEAKYEAVCFAGHNFECWFFDNQGFMKKVRYTLDEEDVIIMSGDWEPSLNCTVQPEKKK